MKKFIQSDPSILPPGFSLESDTEKPIVTVTVSGGQIDLYYVFPGFHLIEDPREIDREPTLFTQVVIASTGVVSESGRPALPSFGRYLRIPKGSAFKVSVEKGHSKQIQGILVMPAQIKAVDSPDEHNTFEYDQVFYDTPTAVHPKEMVSVTGPYRVNKYEALLVHVSPFRYYPADRNLLFHETLKVRISLTKEFDDKPGEPDAIDNLFLPSPGLKKEGAAFHPPEIIRSLPGPEFLIVYAAPFENAARKLATWKNTRGMETQVVPIDQALNAGANIGGAGGNVDSLKAYIRHARLRTFPRLKYALLFGDTDTIPAQEVTPSEFDQTNISDYYYSTETEPNPANPADYLVLPTLAVGRIPVRPDAQGSDTIAMSVVNKIIAYEKDPPTDPPYYKRMVFASSFALDPEFSTPPGHESLGCFEASEHVCSRMEARTYVTQRVYLSNIAETPNLPPPQLFYSTCDPITDPVRSFIKYAYIDNNYGKAHAALIDAVTQGQLFMSYRGHGGTLKWIFPFLTSSDVKGISSCPPTIIFSLCCYTGKFDPGSLSFAETALTMNGAAPSLIASTCQSDAFLNNDLIKAFFDGIIGGVIEDTNLPLKNRRLGDVLNYAKFYLPIAKTQADSFIKDHFEVYHVIGDPTLELWTELPRTFTLDAALINNALEISVAPCPSDCVLTVCGAGKPLASAKAVPGGKTVFTAKDLKPGPIAQQLTVCCWAPGYRYMEVPVQAPGA